MAKEYRKVMQNLLLIREMLTESVMKYIHQKG